MFLHVEVILCQSFRELASVDIIIEISCQHYLTIVLFSGENLLHPSLKQSMTQFFAYHVFAGVMCRVLTSNHLSFGISILFVVRHVL